MEQNVQNQTSPQEETFSISAFLKACALKWKWFLISIIITTAIGAVFYLIQQPKYLRSMSVLIQDQDSGGIGDFSSAFSTFGFGGANANVYNELISIMSPAVMQEVVARLDLQTNYIQKGFPHGTTLYGSNQPFTVLFPDAAPEDAMRFKIEVNPDKSIVLKKFRKTEKNEVIKFNEEIKSTLDAPVIKTPVGRIQIVPNPRYTGKGFEEETTIAVARRGQQATIETYCEALKGDLADKDAEVIDLSIKDVSIERADDILDNVLDVYTARWVEDKNKISNATSSFIEDRLALISRELGDVDEDLSQLRSQLGIPDFEEDVKLNMKTMAELNQGIMGTESQIQYTQYLKEYIDNPSNLNKVIPLNTGVESPVLENQISNYNTLLLRRNNLVESTSTDNPIVREMDSELKGMRAAVSQSVSNALVGLRKSMSGMQSSASSITKELADNPKQAQMIIDISRQRRVKEELYIFLLQRREENELSQTFVANNTRIITPPTGSLKPVSPKKFLILGVSFILGLFFPAAAIYLRESNNTKVRSRKDLERIQTPFLGEIPFVGKKGSFESVKKLLDKKKSAKKLETVPVKVSAGSRDMINESFRIVRGNIDFMTRHKAEKVVMITSFNPGSGKSFICYNLAASFAIKGKRVLIVDCDLRHGSASQYVGMPSKGISSYLTGASATWKNLVIPVKEQENMFVLPIGHRPPNPAELLESDKMSELVKEASQEFDIVFLDCPPVDVVVDTQILAPLADRTIFVVRAGLLEKKDVAEIDELYKNYRFKQMCILLNGTQKQFSRYGGNGSGYYGSAYSVQE